MIGPSAGASTVGISFDIGSLAGDSAITFNGVNVGSMTSIERVTFRGTTVDEAALLTALENRTIKAAGLDVFQNEPRVDPRFMALDNVVLQPHHGSGTIETRQAMGQLVRDNLAAHFAGQPLVTPVL